MAAYRWVYDTHQLQADCQEPGSTPKPHGRQSSMDYLYLLPVSFSLAQLDLFSTQQFRRSSGVKLQGVNSQGVAASPRVCVCVLGVRVRDLVWCACSAVAAAAGARNTSCVVAAAGDVLTTPSIIHRRHTPHTQQLAQHTHTHTSTRAGR